MVELDPSDRLETPKRWRTLPDVLSEDEMNRLLEAPRVEEKLAWRDRALLELAYGAGLRVSELCDLGASGPGTPKPSARNPPYSRHLRRAWHLCEDSPGIVPAACRCRPEPLFSPVCDATGPPCADRCTSGKRQRLTNSKASRFQRTRPVRRGLPETVRRTSVRNVAARCGCIVTICAERGGQAVQLRWLIWIKGFQRE